MEYSLAVVYKSVEHVTCVNVPHPKGWCAVEHVTCVNVPHPKGWYAVEHVTCVDVPHPMVVPLLAKHQWNAIFIKV